MKCATNYFILAQCSNTRAVRSRPNVSLDITSTFMEASEFVERLLWKRDMSIKK